MKRCLMLIPTNADVGLKTMAIGTKQFLANNGVVSDIFQPIYQKYYNNKPSHSVSLELASKHYANGKIDILLEKVVSNYNKFSKNLDIVVIQGLQVEQDNQYTQQLNKKVALALSADIILVTTHQLSGAFDNTVRFMSTRGKHNIVACIINKINEGQKKTLGKKHNIPLIASVPWNSEIERPRMQDIKEYLDAKIINTGSISTARVSKFSLCARSVDNIMSALKPGNLIITSGDRSDIILATAMAVANGCKIAGLLLTGGYKPNSEVISLCNDVIEENLTILVTEHDSFITTQLLHQMERHIHPDDYIQKKLAGEYVAGLLSCRWLKNWLAENHTPKLTPASFCYQLSLRASQNLQKILLPEASDPRIIEAAILAAKRNLAILILLGDKDDITNIALNMGYHLPSNIEIIDPNKIRDKYVSKLVKLREKKGMTAPIAREQLTDNIVLATLMLQQGEADGLVAGSIATTANTIRPALQLIKTKPGVSVVSSIFFMCLPHQVMVYGDCAINPDPDADQLAQIAIASAESADQFGIDPRVAMISYATGTSSKGADVEKVALATKIVNEMKTNYPIDGPLQYDAAINPDVAAKKAPDSKVAGQATVCIFPDLNTGNTTYKAVQRSADVMCIGPMLQGLNKPVNDLSRGATVEDIIFTIVITAIQAQNTP